MCNDLMNVGIQSRLVNAREGFKVEHNQNQWRKYGIYNDRMKVGTNHTFVIGSQGVIEAT